MAKDTANALACVVIVHNHGPCFRRAVGLKLAAAPRSETDSAPTVLRFEDLVVLLDGDSEAAKQIRALSGPAPVVSRLHFVRALPTAQATAVER